MLQLYASDGSATFNSDSVTTVAFNYSGYVVLGKIDLTYNMLNGTEFVAARGSSFDDLTGFKIWDGQHFLLRVSPSGYGITSVSGDAGLSYYTFKTSNLNSGNRVGLQTFNSSGAMTFCSESYRVAVPMGSFSSQGDTTRTVRTFNSHEEANRAIYVPLAVNSNFKLTTGREYNPGVMITQQNTYITVKRSGTSIITSTVKTKDWFVFYGTHGDALSAGTPGLTALILDANNL